MKTAIIERLAALPARTLWLVIGGILLLVLAEGWLLVLRQPLAEYLKLKRERATLESPVGSPAQLPAEVERAERQLAALTERLASAEKPNATDRTMVQLMDRLAALAARHGATLHGVRPVEARRASMFDEMAFDIQGAGSYPALLKWLEDMESELAPFVVTRFSIKRGATAEALAMDLRLAVYRLQTRAGGAK
jgi:Tfp pilus assembly protein PilO